jgi:hypothetical protein
MKFACCKSTSREASSIVTCTKCKHNYHCQCLFPVSKNKELSQETKKTWLCPQCTATQPKPVKTDNTPIRGVEPGSTKTDYSDSVNCRRGGTLQRDREYSPKATSNDGGSEYLDQVKQFLSQELARVKSELETSIVNRITSEFKAMKDEISSLKGSLEFMNVKYEEVTKRMDGINLELKSVVAKTAEVGELRTSLNNIEKDNNSREQWARRSNIEIIGIPQKRDENLMNIIQYIAKQGECELDPSDVDFITRVAPKSNENKRTKPIVVRFLSRWKKDEFMSHVKRLKLRGIDIGFTNSNGPIHLNDHLTSSNKALLQSVKKSAKEKGYMYVWVKNCTIMVRKSDTSPVLHILQPSDLKKVV